MKKIHFIKFKLVKQIYLLSSLGLEKIHLKKSGLFFSCFHEQKKIKANPPRFAFIVDHYRLRNANTLAYILYNP